LLCGAEKHLRLWQLKVTPQSDPPQAD